VALGHASSLEQLNSVLTSREEQPGGGARDDDFEEVVKITKIRHSELGVELIDDALKKSWRGGSKDNVVDVQQVGEMITLSEHKEGDIRGRRNKPKLSKVRGESLVPSAWCACLRP
jgi:hypothetical protein